ncbi:unnamed protein product [Prorocentrum cordatum]|uniref:EGF-like domain-containing protein n=1 Tax=Prorocentrum cordatum TaxID=2364126 RepID=A0ABN9WPM8_9DINO|nr:unnamed protein product [Polarella glacialis]
MPFRSHFGSSSYGSSYMLEISCSGCAGISSLLVKRMLIICQSNRSDLCRDRQENCITQGPFEPCFCEDGYGCQDIRRTADHFGYTYEYTCCPGYDGFECGAFSQDNFYRLSIIGLLSLALGLCGVFVASVRPKCGRKSGAASLSPGDRAVESAPTVRDGERLHREVPEERWCVTKADLRQLRRLVWHAVQEHRIIPTESDPFDASDDRIGPSMHTVNSQFIRPVTLSAGKVSWALMLHPEGLPCDLFITHGWEEGVFEFCDNVMNSWPVGAKHAYLCILSNPQNLNISALVSSPTDSPFAKALASATRMLAVPNRTCSIYSRTWCAYEAYLAYSWQKDIRTARPLVRDFWADVVGIGFLSLSGAGAFCIILATQSMFSQDLIYLAPQVLSLILAFFYAFLRKRPGSVSLRIVIRLIGITSGAYAAHQVTKRPHYVTAWLAFAVMFLAPIALESDRLRTSAAAVATQQLQNGFTGHVRDAKCTVPADGEAIRREIRLSFKEHFVDKNVRDIMRMGIVTKHLREVEELVGPLADVSVWGFGTASIGLIWLVLTAQQLEGGWCGGATSWQIWLVLLEGLCWAAVVARLPPDRVAFATGSVTLVFGAIGVGLFEMALTNDMCTSNYITAAFIGPVILAMSIAGPASVARVTPFGPLLVRSCLWV